MNALILQIQHFSIDDGPGIRSVVFMKGCPLRCVWCHNPESWNPQAELSFADSKCVGCGKCLDACPLQCHHQEHRIHQIDRNRCVACGKCAKVCSGALELLGTSMTPEEVLADVLKDEAFYRSSGGGVTLSGGEPLMHARFSARLLTLAKAHGLHTAVETSGFAPWAHLEALLPLVDLFLFDLKETDPALHKQYTGASNELILENLHRLDDSGAEIVLRCPIIPGLNDRLEHFSGIARVANSLRGVQRIDIEPYHPLGKEKSKRIGRECALPSLGFPTKEMIDGWMSTLRDRTRVPVRSAR